MRSVPLLLCLALFGCDGQQKVGGSELTSSELPRARITLGMQANVGAPTRSALGRHLRGTVTALGGEQLTLTTPEGERTGRIEGGRTRILRRGRTARLSSVQLASSVRGEVGLDDVWTTLEVVSE